MILQKVMKKRDSTVWRKGYEIHTRQFCGAGPVKLLKASVLGQIIKSIMSLPLSDFL